MSTPTTPAQPPTAEEQATETTVAMLIGKVRVPFREYESQKGNPCHAVLTKKADGTPNWAGLKYGTKVPKLAPKLPTAVVLEIAQTTVDADGVNTATERFDVALEPGMTQARNGSEPHAKVSIAKVFELPLLGRRNVQISISEVTGAHNVIAKILPPGSGGGASQVHDLADLF